MDLESQSHAFVQLCKEVAQAQNLTAPAAKQVDLNARATILTTAFSTKLMRNSIHPLRKVVAGLELGRDLLRVHGLVF